MEPRGWKMQCIFGEHPLVGDGASQQCLWPGPGSSSLLRVPPPFFLGTCPVSVTPEVLGETQILLPPLPGLEGPMPGVLQALHPRPLLLGSLESTRREDPRPVLCEEPQLQQSRSEGPSPLPHQLFCRGAPVGRTSVSRVDLPPLERGPRVLRGPASALYGC